MGLALAGILIAVGFSMIGRGGRKAKKAEDREQQFLADGSKKSLAKAKKEQVKSKKYKDQAKVAEAKAKSIVNRVGEKDESMDSMLDRYHKRV